MKILNATPIQIKQIKDIFEKPTTNKMEINDYPFGRILPILSGSRIMPMSLTMFWEAIGAQENSMPIPRKVA